MENSELKVDVIIARASRTVNWFFGLPEQFVAKG
jgi:hypothetical protein